MAIEIAILILIGTALILVFGMISQKSSEQKLLFASNLTAVIISATVVLASDTARQSYLDIALIYILFGYLAIVAIRRLIQGSN